MIVYVYVKILNQLNHFALRDIPLISYLQKVYHGTRHAIEHACDLGRLGSVWDVCSSAHPVNML